MKKLLLTLFACTLFTSPFVTAAKKQVVMEDEDEEVVVVEEKRSKRKRNEKEDCCGKRACKENGRCVEKCKNGKCGSRRCCK